MDDEVLDVFGKHLCRVGKAAQQIRTLEQEKQEIDEMRQDWLKELKEQLSDRHRRKEGK